MKTFNTIKGFLSDGKEEPSEIIEEYSASIRIGGKNLDLQQITKKLGIKPTRTHKQGDKKGTTTFNENMWLYYSTDSINKHQLLDSHLKHLNEILFPHIDFLKQILQNGTINLSCNFTTNRDNTGVYLPQSDLILYNELKIPLDVGFDYIG